jgi:hypothetical protein
MSPERDLAEQDVAAPSAATATVPHFFTQSAPGREMSDSATLMHQQTLSAFGDSQTSIGIWDRFLARGPNSQDEFADGAASSCWTAFKDSCRALLWEMGRKTMVTLQHPDIWLTGLFFLVVLLGASVNPKPQTLNPNP